MSKHKKAKTSAKSRRKNAKVWYGAIAGIMLAGLLAYVFVGGNQGTSAAGQTSSQPAQTASSGTDATLRNRLVLPAEPKSPRPVTLNPTRFSNPEVARSYQVAKDIPEVLEHVPCYCGCYESVGHRNNLDCFADDHGVT